MSIISILMIDVMELGWNVYFSVTHISTLTTRKRMDYTKYQAQKCAIYILDCCILR